MNKDDAVIQFLLQQEGFETRTYIPKVNGVVVGKSGLTFGGGIDIGQMDLREYKALGLPDALESAMLPYVGKQGDDAVAIEYELGHFNIPAEIAMNITRRHIESARGGSHGQTTCRRCHKRHVQERSQTLFVGESHRATGRRAGERAAENLLGSLSSSFFFFFFFLERPG